MGSAPPLGLCGALFPLVLLGLAAYLYPRVGSEFLPKVDDGRVMVKLKLPAGTSVGETDRILHRVEARLQGLPEIQSMFTMAGGTDCGGWRLTRLPRRRSGYSASVQGQALAQHSLSRRSSRWSSKPWRPEGEDAGDADETQGNSPGWAAGCRGQGAGSEIMPDLPEFAQQAAADRRRNPTRG